MDGDGWREGWVQCVPRGPLNASRVPANDDDDKRRRGGEGRCYTVTVVTVLRLQGVGGSH
jgi:hypothetical protein